MPKVQPRLQYISRSKVSLVVCRCVVCWCALLFASCVFIYCILVGSFILLIETSFLFVQLNVQLVYVLFCLFCKYINASAHNKYCTREIQIYCNRYQCLYCTLIWKNPYFLFLFKMILAMTVDVISDVLYHAASVI